MFIRLQSHRATKLNFSVFRSHILSSRPLGIADFRFASHVPSPTKRKESTAAPLDPTESDIHGSDPTAASPKRPQPLTAAYLDLAKAKLSALVVTTAAAGFMAAGGPIASLLNVLAACLIGTGLCSASAAAMN